MDADRVLAWFKAGKLLRPDPLRPSTVSLARALASLGGVEAELDEPSQRVRDAIGDAGHVILVLADGLGLDLVQALPESSFLRSHLVLEMQAVFPSSTAPALTSLATGDWPSRHGLLGWFAYLPDRDVHAITLPFRERFTGRPLSSLGLTGDDVFDWRSLLQDYARDSSLLMPSSIVEGAYTRGIGGGSRVAGYERLEAAVDGLIGRFRTARSPSYTYFYYPRVDSVSHDHGPSSAAVRHVVEGLDSALGRLHEGLAGRARIVVSADHGSIDVDVSRKVMIGPEGRISNMLRTPPSGEPRAPLFHARPGAAADFAEGFRAEYGEQFSLLTAAEVAEMELFGPGPLSATARSRMGDFLALSGEGEALVYAQDQGIIEMAGFHGGLDPREMLIPLIVA